MRLLDRNGNDTSTNYPAQPLGGYYPTSQWKVREAVRDYRDLYIHVPPGQYQLEVTVYPVGQPAQLLPLYGVDGSQKIDQNSLTNKLGLNWPITVLKSDY